MRTFNLVVHALLLNHLFILFHGIVASTETKDVQDPCDACKVLVASFVTGLEATARGKHEGGDTNWEERNLRSYADSEVRLVEIQEQLCYDLKEFKTECHSLAEDTESELEDWWFNQRPKNVRLFDYLCISKLKRCCPPGRYGPQCQACQDCNNHGFCLGNGTRKGDGTCQCEPGYKSSDCRECELGHYSIVTGNIDLDDNSTSANRQMASVTCHKCNPSCNGCFGPGNLMCESCSLGYRLNPDDNSCRDLNECEDLPGRGNCTHGTFCFNVPGRYECRQCDDACAACGGPGPRNCFKCRSNYRLVDGSCIQLYEPIDYLLDDTSYIVLVVATVLTAILFRQYYVTILMFGFFVGLTMAYYDLYNYDLQDIEGEDMHISSSY